MKPTLIIPCCGKLAYAGIPSYIAYLPSGEILLQRALSGFRLDGFDRIVVVIPKQHIADFDAVRKLKTALDGERIEILALDHETSGPAITVLEAVERLGIEGPIVIKDADNFIGYPQSAAKGNFVVGIDVYDYQGEIRQLKNKSFLVANEQKQLLDVVEKRICSPTVCLGIYGFESANEFRESCRRLSDPVYPLINLYVSEVIAYMMGYSGAIFYNIPASDYVNWGNPHDLDLLMKNG